VSNGSQGLTYRQAGVDIAAAAAAVDRIKKHATATLGEAGQPIGHFGGMYRLPAGPDRLLVASADGVGTKLKLAFVLGGEAHARVGADIVNHCVGDILALGARPLFFLDYIALGKLVPETVEAIVSGMSGACRDAGTALIGGETAEMPGIYAEGEYDIAGFIVGEVAPDAVIDGSEIAPGDLLLGFPAVGLHTNGYSLARKIVGLTGDRAVDATLLGAPFAGGDGESVGDALMRPHPSYLPVVRPLLDAGVIRGMAHITGGGLVDNVPRMLRPGLIAEIDPTSWTVPPIFGYLCARGNISADQQYQAFNMGIGYVVAIGANDLELARSAAPSASVIGRVVAGDPNEAPRVRGLGSETPSSSRRTVYGPDRR
jgi:phosphoribosylformylglycinamidine cyclo-ligase